jgi:cell division protein FtsW
MNKDNKKHNGDSRFWNFIDNIEGDKVVWVIVFMLIIVSVLAIFSSTSLLKEGTKDRIDFIKDHLVIVGLGLGIITGLYNIKRIGIFRFLSKLGFIISFLFLFILDLHVRIPGLIEAEYINGAWRTLRVAGLQIHVFEVVKVAMVMYLAWALHGYKEDKEALSMGQESKYFSFCNRFSESVNFRFLSTPFAKRMIYMYLPIMGICVMVLMGSGSSAIFIGGILVAVLIIGGAPFKEIGIAACTGLAILLLIVGVYNATDGKVFSAFERIATMNTRLGADYDVEKLKTMKRGSLDFFEELDKIKQPYSAKIAIHEGGIFGKGIGGSTQKYVVSNIYGDYMFSFIVEEYGLLGGILIILLYVSLLARGSLIASKCSNEFAKIAVGGLSVLITGQAFMHMMVNVDIGPMTGQTLPLISHGSFAFLVFCIAFGVILSISRMAREEIKEVEEAAAPLYQREKAEDDIQASMDILEQIDLE